MFLVFVLVKYNNSVQNHSNGWTWARRKYALRERLFNISMRIPPHPKKYQSKNLQDPGDDICLNEIHFTVVVCGAVSHWERAFLSYRTVHLRYCLIRLTWEQPGALHMNGLSCSEFITVTGSSYTWTQSKGEKFKSGGASRTQRHKDPLTLCHQCIVCQW